MHVPYTGIIATYLIEEELYRGACCSSLGFELSLPEASKQLLGVETIKATFQQLVTDHYSHRHLLDYLEQQGLSAKDIGMIHVGNTYKFPDDVNQHRFPMQGHEVLIQQDNNCFYVVNSDKTWKI